MWWPDDPVEALALLELHTLEEFLVQIDREIASRQTRTREEALARIRAVAAEAGIPLEELLNPPRKRGARPPLYQHPDDASLIWTGLGKRPDWIADLEKAGRAPVDLSK